MSIHNDEDGRSYYHLDNGNSCHCESAQFKQLHKVIKLDLVKGSPGHDGIAIDSAVFEAWTYSGHVWVSVPDIKQAMNLPNDNGNWKWWQKKQPMISKLASDHQLGSYAYRKAMPYAISKLKDVPVEECLPFASISIGTLLVVAVRSAYTSDGSYGRLTHGPSRLAFGRLCDGLLAYLPQD